MTDLQRMTLGGQAKLAQRLSSNDCVVEIAESERARNAQASARGASPAAGSPTSSNSSQAPIARPNQAEAKYRETVSSSGTGVSGNALANLHACLV
jgi:hypothetical protein